MLEINPFVQTLKDMKRAPTCLGGIFDVDQKRERLAEVELELAEPSVWDDPERAQELGRERVSLESVVSAIDTLTSGAADTWTCCRWQRKRTTLGALEDLEAEIGGSPRRSRSSSSVACSMATWTRTTPSWISRPAPAARKRRTGPRCCCACTCAGARPAASDHGADRGLRRRGGGYQERDDQVQR
jgi:hypothetical protein